MPKSIENISEDDAEMLKKTVLVSDAEWKLLKAYGAPSRRTAGNSLVYAAIMYIHEKHPDLTAKYLPKGFPLTERSQDHQYPTQPE